MKTPWSRRSHDRIEAAFARARRERRAAFIPFIMAGDPRLDLLPALVAALAKGGADVIELGVPFSDPIADSPVNQRAATRALEGGTTLSGILQCVADLNRLYTGQPALYEVDFEHTGFEWIDCHDYESSVVAFMRRGHQPDDWIVAAFNWTPLVRHGYRVGVPEPGFYRELLNTDAALYGGGNMGNEGGVSSEPIPAHGYGQSIVLTLPPLAGLLLKPVRTSPSAPPTPSPTPA